MIFTFNISRESDQTDNDNNYLSNHDADNPTILYVDNAYYLSKSPSSQHIFQRPYPISMTYIDIDTLIQSVDQ